MHLACTLHITWEYHFWYTWTILFSKIYHMLGLSGTLSYAVFVYLCIFVFVFLYLRFWHMGISFLIYLNNPLFKNILHVGSFWHFVICCICVFVCLCICVFVFGLGRSLLDQFGQKNASPLSSTFWFESSKPSYLFKSVLLLQPYSIWVGGLAPVYNVLLKRPEIHQKGHWKMQVVNFGKYPMTELGNPTQKSIGKCRIPILRNASQQKREIELKRAVINTDCQILRNT